MNVMEEERGRGGEEQGDECDGGERERRRGTER